MLFEQKEVGPQQSESLVHVPPAAMHPAVAQMLFVHVMEQHWLAVLHVMPAPEHAPTGPQTPLVHTAVQHCDAAVQVPPLVVQVRPWPHAPFVQLLEQHWVSVVQEEPMPRQPAGPHTPPLHSLVQHSVAAAHAMPLALQLGPPVLLLEDVDPLLLLLVVVPLLDVEPLLELLVLVTPEVLDVLLLDVPPPPLFDTDGWSTPVPHPEPCVSTAPASAGISMKKAGRRRGKEVDMESPGPVGRLREARGRGFRRMIRNIRTARTLRERPGPLR